MKPRIAALLTVFNRKEKTLACLSSLEKNIRDNFILDVFLTNDGCTDGTDDMVKELFPWVHIVDGDGNLYWNRGMYKAWCEAEKGDYDYYLWVNDDMLIYENAIELLIKTSKDKNDRSIIVGYTTNNDRTKITYGGRTHFSRLIDQINGVTECSTFNGNFVLVPKWVYSVIGKNDPVFHHAIGDSDYGLRAEKAGIKCFIAKDACGICNTHEKLPRCFDPSVPFLARCKYLCKPGGNGANPNEYFIFRRRHYGLIAAIKTYISNILHLLFPQLWNSDPSKF